MKFSIVGSGHIGAALASQFARQRIDVRIANSRGPASLDPLVRDLGPHVGAVSLREALGAGIVIVAVPFAAVPDAVRDAPDWNGRIVVDATNAIGPAATGLRGRLSTEVVADAVPKARVVKGFNTLFAAVLAQNPARDGGRRVVFLSGNDDAANADVRALVERLGFAPVVLGRLNEGGRLQQFGAPLVGLDLVEHPHAEAS